MKISIVIPTYEAKGKGKDLLSDLLEGISSQDYKNYEIIVSDHSQDDVIENFCKESDLDIHHFYNERGRGNSSINMNEGIKRATGDVIKIMHFDDMMFNPRTLSLIVKKLEENPEAKWGAVTFNHLYEGEESKRRVITPDIEDVVGCPSVSFFKRNEEDPDYFDEELIIINDHDMHQRLFAKYGNPAVVEELCITIRMHSDQVSSWVGKEKEKKEWEYFESKVNE